MLTSTYDTFIEIIFFKDFKGKTVLSNKLLKSTLRFQ